MQRGSTRHRCEVRPVRLACDNEERFSLTGADPNYGSPRKVLCAAPVSEKRFSYQITSVHRQELKKTEKFTLPSFGTFTVHRTRARKALNPKTGASIRVKAGKTVRFKASPLLKRAV
jgi:nucleoid DNA-binding protein